MMVHCVRFLLGQAIHPVRRNTIVPIVRIVVVERPIRVHIPNIVRVAGVGSAEPPIPSRALQSAPLYKTGRVGCDPRVRLVFNFNREGCPVFHTGNIDVKQIRRNIDQRQKSPASRHRLPLIHLPAVENIL